MTDLADGIGLMEWDWCYTPWGTRLHHATLTAEVYEEFADGQSTALMRLTCNRLTWQPVLVPSLSSRLSLPRCRLCCARLGYPPGIGSPKNDSAIRPLVEARIAHLHTTIDGARS